MTTGLSTRGELGISVSDMMKFFTAIIVAVAAVEIISTLTKSSLLSRYVQSQMYQGITDPRVCECVGPEAKVVDLVNDHPFTPWVSAEFVNDGPDSVWIAINNPGDTFELKVGESAAVNRIGAVERIKTIYGSCAEGSSADVRIIGEY